MLATDRGRMWLAKWQSTTPSMSAAPRSSCRVTFNLISMLWGWKQKESAAMGTKTSEVLNTAVSELEHYSQ